MRSRQPSFRRQAAAYVITLLYFTQLVSCGPGGPTSSEARRASTRAQALETLALPADVVVPTSPDGSAATDPTPLAVDVTPDGASSAQVPLWTPPGRAGLQPQLALAYNSRAGNGYLGVGWQLAGLSQVTRCGKTPAQNGAWAPVEYPKNNVETGRFCFDGQQLIAVSGTYGASGTVYRTERDAYVRVVSLEVDSAGPKTFKVYTKDGRIQVFGEDVGSLSEEAGRRLAWNLSRVEDRSGNYLKVTYAKGTVGTAPNTRQWIRPSRIDYTGFGTSEAPRRSVRFLYSDEGAAATQPPRPDVYDGYTADNTWAIPALLKRIEMWGPKPEADGLLRSYQLAYKNNSVSGRSLLASVTECDGTGACKTPLAFEWSLGQLDYEYSDRGWVPEGSDGLNSRTYTLRAEREDMKTPYRAQTFSLPSGGGLVFYARETVSWEEFSSGYGDWITKSATYWGYSSLTNDEMLGAPFISDLDMGKRSAPCDGVSGQSQFMDFNGDGYLDTFYTTCASGMAVPWIAYGSASGFRDVQIDAGVAPPVEFLWADMAGDGVPDLIANTGQVLMIRPVLPSGTSFTGTTAGRITANQSLGSAPAYAVSMDGTARMSLIFDIRALTLKQDGTAVTSSSGLRDAAARRFFDVNGDGLPDAVRVADLTTGDSWIQVYTSLNTGGTFGPETRNDVSISGFSQVDLATCFANPHGAIVADMQGDGREDLLFVGASCAGANGQFAYLSMPAMTLGSVSLGNYLFRANDSAQALDVNRDGLTDFVHLTEMGFVLAKRKGEVPDVLKSVSTGTGLTHKFEYKPLSDANVYTPGPQLSPPLHNVGLTQQVVRRHVVAEDSTERRAWRYAYKDGRQHVGGRGWLGFSEVSVTDEQTGEVTTTQYGNASSFNDGKLVPLAHLPTSQTSVLSLGDGVERRRETRSDYEVRTPAALPGVYQTYAKSTVTKDIEVRNGTATVLSAVEVTQTLDTNGNVTASAMRQVEVKADGTLAAGEETSVTVTSLDFDTGEWLVRSRVAEERWSKPGFTSRTRKTRQDFDMTTSDGTPVTGLLVSSEVQPDARTSETALPADKSAFYLRTTLVPDTYGQVTRVEATAADGTTRVERVEYESAEHLFPAVRWNAFEQPTQYAFHRGLGVLGATRDMNGVTTLQSYDGLGRLRATRLDDVSRQSVRTLDAQGQEVTPADASRLGVTYTWDAQGRPLTTATQAGGATTWETFDAFGRPVLRQTQGFDGQTVSVDVQYDALGRLERMSRPHQAAETAVFEAYQYDALGRLVRQTHPDGTFVRKVYSGLQESTWDEVGREVRRAVDALGRLATHTQMKDGGGAVSTTYGYGAWGQLETVAAPGATTTFGYDVLGRQESVADPNSGSRTRAFNAFGEVKREVDGNGLATTFEYDALGRLLHRSNSRETADFVWDSAEGAGQGRLASATRTPAGTAPAVVTTAYGYDALGRPTWTQQTVDSNPALRLVQNYDAYGRVRQVAYPVVGTKLFSVDYAYNTVGDVASVTGALAASRTTLWTALARSTDGQLTQEKYGNGVVRDFRYDLLGRLRFTQAQLGTAYVQRLSYDYDADGNLSSRSDQELGLTEDFRYDSLDRLERWIVNQNCRRSETKYAYDEQGNLLSRSVLSGTGQSASYTYTGGTSGGPHAVKSATFGTTTASYTYDGNGNQTSGPGRPTVEYTPFNLPSRLDNGVTSTSFDYDAFGTRVRKRSTDADVFYMGGNYQLRVAAGTRTHVFAVPTPSGVAAEVQWQESGTSVVESVRYLHADPLGSPDTVTGTKGEVLERVKYEPFGTRRHAWDVAYDASPTHVGGHVGFTGHEHDDEFGLINMRGRMYDPALGRFLSPDPLMSTGGARSSTNRYAYVLNNPLKYTDPSGYAEDLIIETREFNHDNGEVGGTGSAMSGLGVGGGIGGAIGGVVGGLVGGPLGASIGVPIGSAVGAGLQWLFTSSPSEAGGAKGGTPGGGAGKGATAPVGTSGAAPATPSPAKPSPPKLDANNTGNTAPSSAASGGVQTGAGTNGGNGGTGAPSTAASPSSGHSLVSPTEASSESMYDRAAAWTHENIRFIETLDLSGPANFASGFGDTLTSGFGLTHLFGVPSLTEAARTMSGTANLVDKSSLAYAGGEIAGEAWASIAGPAAAARGLGWEVVFNRYAKAGGGGVNLLRNGARRFGLDWHRFKVNGKMVNRLHYHLGKTASQMKKHRPWQGGWW